MKPFTITIPILVLFLPVLPAVAQATAPAAALPVREVTVFKDGHACVVREAPWPAGAGDAFVIDELPTPVLGTFWPFASGGARLVAARAGRTKVAVDAVATDLRQIARANVGRDVVVFTADKERVEGRLVDVPASRPGAADGALLLVQTASGTRALPLPQVRDLEIRGGFAGRVSAEEQRERLTLAIDGRGGAGTVGVMYVQKGLRWVPSYRIDIDGAGRAAVQFEATLVNDLVDLDRALVHLVVGVPKFEFEGLVDPISLQEEIAQVAAAGRQTADLRNLLSNSLRTQAAGWSGGGDPEPSPAVTDATATEDLFVWTLRDVTLAKGERLVLPVAAFELAYRDVYRVDVPFAPPMEVRQGLSGDRAVELARQLAAPKARHVLRLQNRADAPLTTAPALVLASGRVLAQARLPYASKGREVDLEINVAIDVRVEQADRELRRDPGPIRFGDESFGRVDVAGTITVWNGKPAPILIEVSRRVLGLAGEVGQDGRAQQLDLVQAWHAGSQPGWWGWWNWPHWWFAHNGFAEFRWQFELAAGASRALEAQWHYFWR
jgi:hypothetical protein